MSETKGWLNGFHPLLWVWCFLIDRLIPWRNRMCQGRRLMEQMETCIPQTPCLRLNPPAYCSVAQLQLALSFALHRLSPWVWVERSNPHQICLYVKMQHYSLCPKEEDKTFSAGEESTEAQHVEPGWQWHMTMTTLLVLRLLVRLDPQWQYSSINNSSSGLDEGTHNRLFIPFRLKQINTGSRWHVQQLFYHWSKGLLMKHAELSGWERAEKSDCWWL